MISSDDARWQSVFPLRAVGYGLLVLAAFDIANIFIPANFTNYQWEFSVFGEMVERVPVPLIGLALVFLGRTYGRNIWEKRLVLLLSWVSLFVGILFFLLAPFGFNSFRRIENQVTTTVDQQVTQRTARAAEIEGQIEAANANQLEIFAARLNQQGRTIVDGTSEELRTQILAELDTATQRADRQARRTVEGRLQNLRKNFIKWTVGAVVSGILFIYIWATTGWSRRNLKQRRS